MLEFYRRQIQLIGTEAQEKISKSRVMIIGCGGLGHPVASYLAAAGVGEIHLVDFDVVSESNLHRQVLFKIEDCEKKKADVLAMHLRAQNPHISIHAHSYAFNSSTSSRLLKNIDLVIDATDNFTTKFLIHEKCHEIKIPLLQGSISSWQGHLHFFDFKECSPCFECLYPTPPKEGCVSSCAEAGVMGSTAGVFGTLMSNEAIKFLIGSSHLETGLSLLFNLETLEIQKLRFKKNSLCTLCHPSPRRTVHEFEVMSPTDYPEAELVDLRDNPDFMPLSDTDYLLVCQRGVSSLKKVQSLREQGFPKIKSLKGGVASL
jgi:molybdopterin/thiamine biosynthesis adenylyltransferase